MFQRGVKLARLVGLEGVARGMSFYLWEKCSFLLGSALEADIFLAGSRVKKRHAQIESDDNTYVLTDFSSGDTFINGESVDICALQEGDHLRVGHNILVFNHRQVTETNFLHVQEDIEVFNRQKINGLGQGPCLKVLTGLNEGFIYSLKDKESYTLGRNSISDIKILDKKLSRVHCRIERDGKHFVLMDHGSTNGTFVNGEPVNIYLLKTGDHIRVGITVMEFKV